MSKRKFYAVDRIKGLTLFKPLVQSSEEVQERHDKYDVIADGNDTLHSKSGRTNNLGEMSFGLRGN